jgi:hypothetical protein
VSSLRQSVDDPVQLRLQRFVGWRRYFDELRCTFGAAPVHAVQHQAMQIMIRAKDGDFFISDWLRNRNTV